MALGRDRREALDRLWPDLGLAVHGQSFAEQAVTENLARGYPAAMAGWLNIGVLHLKKRFSAFDGDLLHDIGGLFGDRPLVVLADIAHFHRKALPLGM